jgi:branched-chain amino acid transport system substrate-binding protein
MDWGPAPKVRSSRSLDTKSRQATNFRGLSLGMLTTGMTIDTSPADYYPIEQVQLIRFTGERWQPRGPVFRGEVRSSE